MYNYMHASQLMFIELTQSQHEGGVANGHINFTKCSIPDSSALHGGMVCIAVTVTHGAVLHTTFWQCSLSFYCIASMSGDTNTIY